MKQLKRKIFRLQWTCKTLRQIDSEDNSQAMEDITVDRINNLERDMGYLEREMHRSRTMLTKLQSDPMQTPVKLE